MFVTEYVKYEFLFKTSILFISGAGDVSYLTKGLHCVKSISVKNEELVKKNFAMVVMVQLKAS